MKSVLDTVSLTYPLYSTEGLDVLRLSWTKRLVVLQLSEAEVPAGRGAYP